MAINGISPIEYKLARKLEQDKRSATTRRKRPSKGRTQRAKTKTHPSDGAAKVGPMNGGMVSTDSGTVTPRYHDTVTPKDIEQIRKSVKELGKEAATHRFSSGEKKAIASIVYAYGTLGIRTSENEIARIAIHWLILDYQRRGKQGVLDQVLRALSA